MNELQNMMQRAEQMLSGNGFEAGIFREMENFVLKHQSAMKTDAEFVALKDILDEIARKYGQPTIKEQQEGFGLNSCAC